MSHSSTRGPTDSIVLDHLRADNKLPGRVRLPPVEDRAARGLPRGRSQGTALAPAGRPHHAGRHHAQPGRRRHLSVRRCHRAARPRAAVRRADPRAGRNPRQSRGSGRGVRQRRTPAALQSVIRPHVAARSEGPRRAAAYRDCEHMDPAAAWRRADLAEAARHHHGDRQSRAGHRRGSNAATATWSIAPPCRCRTAPRW